MAKITLTENVSRSKLAEAIVKLDKDLRNLGVSFSDGDFSITQDKHYENYLDVVFSFVRNA